MPIEMPIAFKKTFPPVGTNMLSIKKSDIFVITTFVYFLILCCVEQIFGCTDNDVLVSYFSFVVEKSTMDNFLHAYL